jgi:hypothetical protein
MNKAYLVMERFFHWTNEHYRDCVSPAVKPWKPDEGQVRVENWARLIYLPDIESQ